MRGSPCARTCGIARATPPPTGGCPCLPPLPPARTCCIRLVRRGVERRARDVGAQHEHGRCRAASPSTACGRGAVSVVGQSMLAALTRRGDRNDRTTRPRSAHRGRADAIAWPCRHGRSQTQSPTRAARRQAAEAQGRASHLGCVAGRETDLPKKVPREKRISLSSLISQKNVLSHKKNVRRLICSVTLGVSRMS